MPRKGDGSWNNSATAHYMKGVSVVFGKTSALDRVWIAYQFSRDPRLEISDSARRAGGTPAELLLCSLWFTECPLFIYGGEFTSAVPKLAALLISMKLEDRRVLDITVLNLFEQVCGYPLPVSNYIVSVSDWSKRLENQVVHTLKMPVKTCVQV